MYKLTFDPPPLHKIGVACTCPCAPLPLKLLQLCQDEKRLSELRRQDPYFVSLTQPPVPCPSALKKEALVCCPRTWQSQLLSQVFWIRKWKTKGLEISSHSKAIGGCQTQPPWEQTGDVCKWNWVGLRLSIQLWLSADLWGGLLVLPALLRSQKSRVLYGIS